MQKPSKKVGKCCSWRLNVPVPTPCLGRAEFWTPQETGTYLAQVQSITQTIRTVVGVKIMSTSHLKFAPESLRAGDFSIWLPRAPPCSEEHFSRTDLLGSHLAPFQKLAETQILRLISSFYCLVFPSPYRCFPAKFLYLSNWQKKCNFQPRHASSFINVATFELSYKKTKKELILFQLFS